ncbi:unnamed protein product [Acanthoscelides obtectus]|uniref:Uncharacterized protein n=1 Tax=Acanthoscelides obtectus TaxID=200917 RepID=A0A9P0LUT3_ACAOB|nr:unnamed protein product [Acanthoscelides obtectus]CAK1651325.1 hypothetical protein AOBTE_LOCUS17186 [Acanthoscelides obtectus]
MNMEKKLLSISEELCMASSGRNNFYMRAVNCTYASRKPSYVIKGLLCSGKSLGSVRHFYVITSFTR